MDTLGALVLLHKILLHDLIQCHDIAPYLAKSRYHKLGLLPPFNRLRKFLKRFIFDAILPIRSVARNSSCYFIPLICELSSASWRFLAIFQSTNNIHAPIHLHKFLKDSVSYPVVLDSCRFHIPL